MKSLTLVVVCLLPLLLHGQGAPERKLEAVGDAQEGAAAQRPARRILPRTDNQSLAAGDPEGAETGLKAAIAQGAMTQSQIEDARGQFDSLVSRQRETMVAEARAAREQEAREQQAREAEASRMAGGGHSLRLQGSQPDRVFLVHVSNRFLSIARQATEEEAPGNVEMATARLRLEAGEWTAVRVCLRADEIAAQVGDAVVRARHPSFSENKTAFAFLVSGSGAGFRNLVVTDLAGEE